jgi:hypothetical protein
MINAFHPLFIKTHMPNFLKDFRTHEANRQAAAAVSSYVTKQRKVKPSHGTLFGISDKVTAVTTPAHMHRPKAVNLDRTEYHTYAKAGMPKTRSQMMSDIVSKKRKTNSNYGTALPDSVNIPKVKPKEAK